MAIFNLRRREIQAKIVYYGPGLSGKTTNLQYIHQKLKPEHKGELMTLATQTDRTLFFDFLPIELGEIRGLKTRFQLYTVPGQVFYNSTRKLVLKNADGIVFVADSRAETLNDNLESLRNLEQNLEAHKLNIRSIPLVMQFNKRDMPNAMSVAELNKHLNPYKVPVFSAEAHKGLGVLETLSAICKAVIKDLREKDPQNFRSPEDSGLHTRIATSSSANASSDTTSDSAPAPEQVLAQSLPPTNLAVTQEWLVAPSERTAFVKAGVLHVPVLLVRGSEKIKLELTVSVDSLKNA